MNEHYQDILLDITAFIDEQSTKLQRPIKDLEDIRVTMLTLETVRQRQIEIDMSLGPVEVCPSSSRACP